MAHSIRLLPFAIADGPANMAADEVLLEAAVAGQAGLRFYGWTEATVSLGYFQPEQVRRDDPLLTSLPYVRRATGGMTLVHHHELTYALALPAGPPWQVVGQTPWLCRMHAIIGRALQLFGVEAHAASCSTTSHASGSLCFHQITSGDLVLRGAKVVGSAQRRQRGALLQHGAVLLASSPAAPQLAGIEELAATHVALRDLADGIARAWAEETGWPLVAGASTSAEETRLAELIRTKYSNEGWNRKR